MPPRRANKTKAQRAFEQEKARVGQILFERGEVPPPKDVFDEAWLRQWNADEALLARKPEILQILLGRGEAPPTGGMTIPWLQTWDAAEDARVKAEAKREEHARYNAKRKASPERDNRLREAKNAKRRAQTTGDAGTQHAAAQPVVAQPMVAEGDGENLQALKADFVRVAKLEAEYAMFYGTKAYRDDVSDADDDNDGPLLDDLSDDEDFPEASDDLTEDLGPPQKKQKTEGQQSSVTDSTKKPADEIRVKLVGWKRKGNARKALAQQRAAKLSSTSDCAIFEEIGNGLQDEDEVLDESEKKATVQNLPLRFRMSSDPRLGVPAVDAAVDFEDKERLERFEETARNIIRFLKTTANEFLELPKSVKRRTWKPMVSGMLTMLRNASEEYLLECLFSGIDDSVRSTLGKPDFTVDDLVNLPGGSVDQNIEKGVYVDILHIMHGSRQIQQLYVGAATGKFGLAQRWNQYLTKKLSKETGKHALEVMKSDSTVCLRALARYGQTPYPWLVCLAETFFMLYLGTIEDPGHRPDPGHCKEPFINDTLYKNVRECRRFAGLTSRIAVGLNSTWSLSQGYRYWVAYAKSACGNCSRKIVPRKDPLWEPMAFVSINPERPGEEVECRNCMAYRRRMGVNRPLREEKKLMHRKTVRTPKLCQGPNCTKELLMPGEVEVHFHKYQSNDQRSPYQCPVTGKHVPRVFQNDRVLQGRCYWVCNSCSTSKMGFASQLSGKRVGYSYAAAAYKKRQASSSEAS
ncbi:hypothetical protein J4E86_009027 [Alternaria arbusti]|uniref:uncharacterized protein n=1 Tax=Alternaria arbusti TaxID=232088 RepID=UPI00221EF8F7|nr:uncharacterized protein J4E86_009027 [Alternaria arbusti]KAI4946322.1 hypothetical protein J4E86_009027 [Alternaria arbusti]